MLLRTTAQYSLWTLDSSTSESPMVFSGDFRNATIGIQFNNFSGEVEFYASNSESRPDLSSAVSSTNQYQKVDSVDLQTWNSTQWKTSTFSGESSYKRYEINDNNNNWVWIAITNVTNSVNVNIDLSDNQ